jgi:hypothetical protein
LKIFYPSGHIENDIMENHEQKKKKKPKIPWAK